jgi:hypothetical protein
MRAGMRDARRRKVETLLLKGMTKAEVARTLGLSPSRISAMFKVRTKKPKLPNGGRVPDRIEHAIRCASEWRWAWQRSLTA